MLTATLIRIRLRVSLRCIKEHAVELLAVTVMPGPQTVGAVASCREIRARFPNLPIVWGGYFASNYTAAALNAKYVDYAVRGQGEQTFVELLEAIRGNRDLKDNHGLSYKDADGVVRHNPERPMRSPVNFPGIRITRCRWSNIFYPLFWESGPRCIKRASDVPIAAISAESLRFPAAGRKWNRRREPKACCGILGENYGVDAVQFYDNNFFLREDHTRELGRPTGAFEDAVVVRRPHRHHDEILGRDVRGHAPRRLHDDFLRSGIRVE